jgi:hypothetical protein
MLLQSSWRMILETVAEEQSRTYQKRKHKEHHYLRGTWTKDSRQIFAVRKSLIPRHQRDIGRLMAMIKACALLNLWGRERRENDILVTETDVNEGFRVYEDIARSNELGLPPEVFNIFKEIGPKIPETGITRREFLKLYYETFHRTIGKKRFDEVIEILLQSSLLFEELNLDDKRQKKISVTPQGVHILQDLGKYIQKTFEELIFEKGSETSEKGLWSSMV